jgi:hypothetical protein
VTPGARGAGWTPAGEPPSAGPAREPPPAWTIVLQAAAVAGQGVLHATAAGALLLVALRLAAPGVLDGRSAGRAGAEAIALGLACLRVPLGSGDLSGTFAPLGGALATAWGIAVAVRRWSPGWPGGRGPSVAVVAGSFAVACSAAAALARFGTPLEPSLLGSGLAGAAWGALGAAWGTARRERGETAGTRRARARAGTARLLGAHPRVGPGVAGVAVAAVLGAVAAGALLVVQAAGASPSEAAGTLLLGIAAAPNAAATLVSLGLGAPVEVVLGGTAAAETTRATFALWDWAGRGAAPPHVLALVLVPACAVVAAGRAAARVAPDDPTLVRGLVTGVVLAGSLVTAGWAGSLRATAGPAAGSATLSLGVSPVPVVVLALAWSIAGAYVGSLVPRPRRAARSGAGEDGDDDRRD